MICSRLDSLIRQRALMLHWERLSHDLLDFAASAVKICFLFALKVC